MRQPRSTRQRPRNLLKLERGLSGLLIMDSLCFSHNPILLALRMTTPANRRVTSL
jgi:hypothetical protein